MAWITGGTYYYDRISIQAAGGGVIDLSKVAQIADPTDGDTTYRSIDVTADGTDSLVKLDSLTRYTDQNSYDFGNFSFTFQVDTNFSGIQPTACDIR